MKGHQSLRTRTQNRRQLSAPLAGEVEPQVLSVNADMYRGDQSLINDFNFHKTQKSLSQI